MKILPSRAIATIAKQTPATPAPSRLLVASVLFTALVVAAVGSLGAPLITSVGKAFHVSLAAAQWTLTITLLSGAVASPVLGRLGAGPRRKETILVTLGVVVAGSVLTVVPLSFAWLLAGRAAQGVGLGLTALMMGVARDHLPPARSGEVIAMISVASTAGIGIGYPLAGFLTDVSGVRAAYGLGLAVTALALIVAWSSLPPTPAGRTTHVDIPGALLLAGGLLALLLVASQTDLWRRDTALPIGLLGAAAVLLAGWVWRELHTDAPLVDVRLVRHPAVARANVAMMTGGAGMYLLLTLLTRYAQTPKSANYGFGLSVFWAGLALVPFSVMGFLIGRFNAALNARFGPWLLLAGNAATVLIGFLMFRLARGNIALIVVELAILGLGVGGFSAAMPAVVLKVTPASETSSAMAFNQVVRSVGFSFGSAVGGLVLAAYPLPGLAFPANGGYSVAAWIGAAIMAVTTVVALTITTGSGGGQAPDQGSGSRPSPVRR